MKRDRLIKCIFFSEFHPITGPKIVYQVPEDFISKEQFDTFHVYIITKSQLKDRIITINALGYKLVGCPVCIEGPKYARNALIFNLVLVFDCLADTVLYESVVRKLAFYLTNLEVHSSWLTEDTKERLPSVMTQIKEELNDSGSCCCPINESTTIHLKLIHDSKDPPSVQDHDVPILIPGSSNSRCVSQWDLATRQLIPYIDGFKHVARIAVEADVEVSIVKVCVQNLVYHGAVKLISIFQFSNVYVVTSDLPQLIEDKSLQDECIQYVARPGKYPRFRDVLQLFCGLKAGATVRDLCTRHNPHALGVEERKLIQYGSMRGLIRRLHKYAIKVPNEAGSCRLKMLYKWLNGNHSYDEICCKTGIGYQELSEKIEADPSVMVCWK